MYLYCAHSGWEPIDFLGTCCMVYEMGLLIVSSLRLANLRLINGNKQLKSDRDGPVSLQ